MAVLQGFQELCGELIQGGAASLSYFAALGWGCMCSVGRLSVFAAFGGGDALLSCLASSEELQRFVN